MQGFSLKAASINVAGNNNVINNCQILYPTPYTAPDELATAPPASRLAVDTIRSATRRSATPGATASRLPTPTTPSTTTSSTTSIGRQRRELRQHHPTRAATTQSPTTRCTMPDGMESLEQRGFRTNDNTVIQHNNISRYGILTEDLGGIYAYNTDPRNSSPTTTSTATVPTAPSTRASIWTTPPTARRSTTTWSRIAI